MTDALWELLVFGGQVLLVVAAVLVVRAAFARRDGMASGRRQLRVEDLSQRYGDRNEVLRGFMSEGGAGFGDGDSGGGAKAGASAGKGEDAEAGDGVGKGGKGEEAEAGDGVGKGGKGEEAKAGAKPRRGRRRWLGLRRGRLLEEDRPCVFVFDFRGDIQASAAKQLGELVGAVLAVAREGDEALCRLQSPGGVVDGYGLVAAELMRFRAAGVRLTVAVDRVAASGGYLAACVGDSILAAPFAYVGSIGVYLGIPNLHRLLQRYDVDFETVTAGNRKRSLTVFGENTDEARELAREQVDRVHGQFKGFIAANRPKVDVEKVADGDVWSAEQALEIGLVDAIGTSAQWIQERVESHRVLQLSWRRQRGLGERLFARDDEED